VLVLVLAVELVVHHNKLPTTSMKAFAEDSLGG